MSGIILGPFTSKANALPLSHIPNCYCICFALQLIVIIFDTYIIFLMKFSYQNVCTSRNASAAWNISCILTYDLIGINMLEITFSHIHLFYKEVQIFDGCVTDMYIFTIIIRQDKNNNKTNPAHPMFCPNVECKTFIYFNFHPQRTVLIICLCIWQNVEQPLKSSHNRRSVNRVFLKRATPT